MIEVWVNFVFRSNLLVKFLNYRVKLQSLVMWEGVSPDGYSLRSTHKFCNCTGTLMVPLQFQCYTHELHYSHGMHYNGLL